MQKGSKLEFLSSCCDLVILVDFCTYSLLISVLKGLWDASAHVRQLDFCSGEQKARESHIISIQELFGPFGKF